MVGAILQSPLFWIAALAVAAALTWPRFGLLAKAAEWRENARRRLLEDALKHVLIWDQEGRVATLESLTGALRLSPARTLQVVTRMQSRGLLRSAAGGLRLTAEGERLGLHVVRAHRLWERYLADDAGVPLERLHSAAERAEHTLSTERLDQLDAHLGHPESDPHGDPIPAADGSVAPLNAAPLTDWPSGEPARIVHIEDEPEVIFQQIVAANLRPEQTVRILEKTPTRLLLSDGEVEIPLAPAVAANIQVAAELRNPERLAGLKRLSELRLGEHAEVVEVDASCRGFTRRRLMDLGLTPSARVEVALENTFGDPRAFRVRSTTVALRKQQTEQVWVRVRAPEGVKAA